MAASRSAGQVDARLAAAPDSSADPFPAPVSRSVILLQLSVSTSARVAQPTASKAHATPIASRNIRIECFIGSEFRLLLAHHEMVAAILRPTSVVLPMAQW